MKMSLTRVLNEIKLLDKKIETAASQPMVMVKVGGKPNTGYSTVKEMEERTKANFQSVKDLVTRRNKLKSLLTQANADTEVTIAGETMSIAQAIERKNSGIKIEKKVLASMANQLSHCTSVVDTTNARVQQKVDELLNTLSGRERKASQEEIEAVEKPYRDNNAASLVDSFGIRATIESMNDKIEQFENEVDFSLSEINARTEIEVD